MTHDFYRPISQCRLAAGLDADGNLIGLHVRVSGPVDQRLPRIPRGIVGGKDMRQLQGYYEEPGDAQLGYTRAEPAASNTRCATRHVPVGPWRGVNTNQNGVYMECFMDEVAQAAGKDPLEFRRALMSEASQASRRAQRGGGEGRLGQAAACRRASRHRAVHGLRQLLGRRRGSLGERPTASSRCTAWCWRSNCGHAVNPDQIAAQVEGSVAYGLTRGALRRDARSRTAAWSRPNFDNYQIMRLAEMPKVETVIVPTLRFLGRRRRADDLRRRACGAQRDPRGDRQAGAQPAAEERQADLTRDDDAVSDKLGCLRAPLPPCGPLVGRGRGWGFWDQKHQHC